MKTGTVPTMPVNAQANHTNQNGVMSCQKALNVLGLNKRHGFRALGHEKSQSDEQYEADFRKGLRTQETAQIEENQNERPGIKDWDEDRHPHPSRCN
jgi:hypothetical protein